MKKEPSDSSHRRDVKAKYDTSMRIPIVLSFVGPEQCNERETEYVIKSVIELVSELWRKYRNTEIVLLTSLDKGIERKVALALNRLVEKPEANNKKTKAVCCPRKIKIAPIARSLENHYDEEVEKLLDDAFNPCEIPICQTDKKCDLEKECDKRVAAYKISHSHMIVAVWDGKYDGRDGSVCDTIWKASTGIDFDMQIMSHPIPPEKEEDVITDTNYLNFLEDCPIYLINTTDSKMSKKYIVPEMARNFVETSSRQFWWGKSTENTPTEEFSLPSAPRIERKVHYASKFPEYYERSFMDIDEANEDISVIEKELSPYDHEAYSLLKGEEDEEGRLTGLQNERAMEHMAARYNAMDKLAIKYQKKSFRDISYSIVVMVFIGIFFQTYILFDSALALMALYMVFLLISWAIFILHRKTEKYKRFIEYRTLAESIRVNYYWSLVGLNESVSALCFGYMRNEMRWIRNALKAWGSFFMNDFPKFDESPEAKELLDRNILVEADVWFRSQATYHSNKLYGKPVDEKKAGLITKLFWERYPGGKTSEIKRYTLKGNNNRIIICDDSRIIVSMLLLVTSFVALVSGFTDAFQIVYGSFGPIVVFDVEIISEIQITMIMIIKALMIVLTASMVTLTAFREKLIHGGTPEQIKVKINLFDVASKRVETISIEKKDDTKYEALKKENDECLHVLYELGVQCIDEVNDWAFEHKAKDMSAPTTSILSR